MSSGQQWLIGVGPGRGGSRVLAGFEMGHCGRVAFPLALRLGAISDPPGCKCPLFFGVIYRSICRDLSSVCPTCAESPHCSASEGKTEQQDSAPDLLQPRLPDDMKLRCRFQPVPGSFGGAGVPGQEGTPTQQQASQHRSSSLWQTGAQSRGSGCSITSLTQGVLPGR